MGLTYLLELNEETYEGLVFFNDWNTFVLVVKVELSFWYPSILYVYISMYTTQKTE